MIDYSGMRYSKGTPRVVVKMQKARLADAIETKCRKKVNRRDGRRCFFPRCKTPASDKHHVRPRSLGGQWISRNILSSCRRHHDYFKAGLIQVRGNPDRGPVKVVITLIGQQAGIRVPSRMVA